MAVVLTAPTGTDTRRVLIVDDEPDIRDLYRYAFEHEGYSVEEAVDGIDAVERAAEFQPALVVLDLAMPRRDGLAALPLIRSVAPDARVIIVTAYSTVEAFSTGRRLGAQACFQKERFIPHIPEVWDRFCR
jgi:two-component system response regulator MprA